MEKVSNKDTDMERKGVQAPEEMQANERDVKKVAELKAKKAAAAKAWKERKDKEASERQKTAADLIKYLADKKITLPESFSKLLNEIASPSARTSSSGSSPLFEKLFGANPKVGDKVTLIEVFQKSYKSKAEIDRYVKQWAEKGIVIEFTQDANMLGSTYTIKKLA